MKTIVILYAGNQINDAEHAKGVLEEELSYYNIATESKKQTLKTATIHYVFQNIEDDGKIPKHITSIYVSDTLSKHAKAAEWIGALKASWIPRPTFSIIDYVGEAESEIDRKKVTRYVVGRNDLTSLQVEQFKAHRIGYATKEEAETVLRLKNQPDESQKESKEPVIAKKRSKKITPPEQVIEKQRKEFLENAAEKADKPLTKQKAVLENISVQESFVLQ